MEKYGIEMPTYKVVKTGDGHQIVVASGVHIDEAKELSSANPGSIILREL